MPQGTAPACAGIKVAWARSKGPQGPLKGNPLQGPKHVVSVSFLPMEAKIHQSGFQAGAGWTCCRRNGFETFSTSTASPYQTSSTNDHRTRTKMSTLQSDAEATIRTIAPRASQEGSLLYKRVSSVGNHERRQGCASEFCDTCSGTRLGSGPAQGEASARMGGRALYAATSGSAPSCCGDTMGAGAACGGSEAQGVP
jgi:hypothetical protein